jgi:hypothetical protein
MTHHPPCPLHLVLPALLLVARISAADVVAIVSSKSTIPPLSKTQVTDIFLGKVRRFPDGAVAVPLDLPEDLPQRTEFYKKLTDKSPAQVKAYWSKIIFTGRGQPPQAVSSSIEMKKRLVENPAAIGYIDASLVDASVRVLF